MTPLGADEKAPDLCRLVIILRQISGHNCWLGEHLRLNPFSASGRRRLQTTPKANHSGDAKARCSHSEGLDVYIADRALHHPRLDQYPIS